jgi:hypothetical protein
VAGGDGLFAPASPPLGFTILLLNPHRRNVAPLAFSPADCYVLKIDLAAAFVLRSEDSLLELGEQR